MRSWAVLRTILLKNQTSFFKEAIFCVIITAFLFLPLRSEAVIIFPYFNLTIVKNTSGGDGDFSFHLGVYPAGSPLPADLQDFNITTLSGTGSHFISEFVGPGTTIYLTENSAEGWQMGDVSCVSSNPLVTAVEIEGGVWINTAPYSSATCTFTNTKGEEVPDPVIIIPGILGSAEKNGVWVIDPIMHVYDDLIETLIANGYEKDKTLFTLPYDWHNSNIVTEVKLRDKIAEVEDICDCNKVDIVAHSMGGLVARYYIQSPLYRNDVDQLIFLGTPHLGAPKAYIPWESGDNVGDTIDWFLKHIFSKEAKKNGFSNVFEYIRNQVTSIKELLPTHNYLKDKNSGELLNYPENYPRNQFLENLNNNISVLLNSNVTISNLVGNTGVGTINIIRIASSTDPVLWEHGVPDGFYSNNSVDKGLEVGEGDGTVTINSASFIYSDLTATTSSHTDLPSKTEWLIYKNLTGKDAQTLIDKSRVPNFILIIKMLSPADIQVVAPDGKIVGKNFETGEEINEIDGSFYSGFNTDDEYVTIPNPSSGGYIVKTKGTGSGAYTVVTGLISDSGSIEEEVIGTTKPDFEAQIEVNVSDDSIDVSSPDAQAITLESVIADIEQAYSDGWINNKNIKNLLIRQIKALVRIEKLETKVDKLLAKALEKELQLYLNKGFINQQVYDLLKNDLELLMLIY